MMIRVDDSTIGQFREILARIDWSDGFVRELYLASPSYVCPDLSVVEYAASPDLIMLVSVADPDVPGLELLFRGVAELCLPLGSEYAPRVDLQRDAVEFCLQGELQFYRIAARELWCRSARSFVIPRP
ncbi:MAG TPA: hypothetical protein VGQ83_28410 [Polyangia bacterium]|jgi:hypothetical protein